MKTFFHNRKGVTLVEILVAFVLVSLIAIAILPALTFGYLQIDDSGDKTKALGSVQQTIETEFAKATVPVTNSVSITFGSTSFSVQGTTIEKEEAYGNFNSKVKVMVFIPNK